MPVPLIAAGIGAAVSIGGGLMASKAQKKAGRQASQTAQNVANQNNALTREIYNENAGNMRPFMERGNAAGGVLSNMLLGGPNADAAYKQFRDASGYQNAFSEAMRGVNTGYAGRGALQSGAAIRGAAREAGNIATGTMGNYMNMLSQQQNMGMTGAAALAGAGQNLVNAVTANNNMAGGALANSQLMAGQSNANMWQNGANAIGSLAGAWGSSYKPAGNSSTYLGQSGTWGW